MDYILYNGKIILKDRILNNGYVTVNGNRIADVSEGKPDVETLRNCKNIIDAKGKYISPGFIDIHVHGGGGKTFAIGKEESFLIPCETHAIHGTTSIYPSISSSTIEIMENAISCFTKTKKHNDKGSYMRGLHFEGPYFSANQKGAQEGCYLRDPVKEEYLRILDMTDDIKRWSCACELKGMEEFAACLKKRGIKASIGHCDATYDEVVKAHGWGFDLITHLYSCCSTIKREKGYRIPGVIESAYLIDDMDVEIICDGHHLPDSLIQFAYKFKGSDRTAIISDALCYAGMDVPNGTAVREDIIIEDGVAKLTDRSAFGGSVATFDKLVRIVLKAGISLVECVKMSSYTPARIMGIDNVTGSLEKGKDADIIVFDESINMFTVIIQGNRIL